MKVDFTDCVEAMDSEDVKVVTRRKQMNEVLLTVVSITGPYVELIGVTEDDVVVRETWKYDNEEIADEVGDVYRCSIEKIH